MKRQTAFSQTQMGTYGKDYSANFIKILGAFEVLGAIGVVLPWLTGILPWLISFAAVGLGIIMLGATNVRYQKGETQLAVSTAVFFLMCAFVAYGRYVLWLFEI